MNRYRAFKIVKKNKILKEFLARLSNIIPVYNRYNLIRFTFSYPYSQTELENKIIFVHVPKAAGNGIIKSLYNLDNMLQHATIQQYMRANSDYYSQFFKFGFVRNPWDKLVSAYFYLKQGGMGTSFELEFTNKYLKRFETFDDFIYFLGSSNHRDKYLKWVHFIPQYKFLCDKDGQIAVDFIGKYENIEQDFNYLKEKLNRKNAILQVYNNSKHKPFWEYYNKLTVELVREIYKKDIELFGYTFPYEKLKTK